MLCLFCHVYGILFIVVGKTEMLHLEKKIIKSMPIDNLKMINVKR